jgi:hypothetical protein
MVYSFLSSNPFEIVEDNAYPIYNFRSAIYDEA